MILDIRFIDRAPMQIQGVRRTTVYTGDDDAAELVIHFYDYVKPVEYFALSIISNVTCTND